MMKLFPLAAAGLLIGTAAIAQPAPPRPMAPGAGPVADSTPAGLAPDTDAPPPPGGPRGDRPPPPPPPRGASFKIDRGPDGAMRIDVHCAERDTTSDCAAITTRILDKVASDAKAK